MVNEVWNDVRSSPAATAVAPRSCRALIPLAWQVLAFA